MNLYELRAGTTKPTKIGMNLYELRPGTTRSPGPDGISGIRGWDPRLHPQVVPPHTRTKNSTFACETDGSDQKPDSESFRIAFGADPAISPDPIPGWDLRDHRLGSPGPGGISGSLLVVRKDS